MAFFVNHGIRIAGMLAAVPKNKIEIKDFYSVFDKSSVDKFIKSTGIESVHRTFEHQTASDLAYVAAENLLKELSIDRKDIGTLIFVTLSPDYRRPATSCILQMRLGLDKDCMAMDVNHGCSGFVYGHQTIESLMMSSDKRYGILLLGETVTKVVGKKDHSTMLFGDAGAAVLYEKDGDEVHNAMLCSDGTGFKAIVLPAGEFRDPNPPKIEITTKDNNIRSNYDLWMDGMAVFSFTISDVPKTIKEYFKKSNTNVQDYDLFAFHQANIFIIKQLSKKLKIEEDKIPICLDRYGNTSGVSIPLTLCDYYGHKKGIVDKVLASGFGVGLSWGVVSFSIYSDVIFPVIETDEYFKDGILNINDL